MLVKMLMEIDPLPMRGSLVMTMVITSPSRREVSLAERLHQSPRLVPPRFRLVVAEFRPVSLPSIFFQGKSDDIAEDGRGGPPGAPGDREGRLIGGGLSPGQDVAPLAYFFRS